MDEQYLKNLYEQPSALIVVGLFLVLSLCVTIIYIYMSGFLLLNLGNIVSVIQMEEYFDSLPIMWKLKNLNSPLYETARDIYCLNLIMLLLALLGNYHYIEYWRDRFIVDIESSEKEIETLYSWVRFLRRLAMAVCGIGIFLLLFDVMASSEEETYKNQLYFNKWNGVRVPFLAFLVYASCTYLTITYDIFIGFEIEEENNQWEEVN